MKKILEIEVKQDKNAIVCNDCGKTRLLTKTGYVKAVKKSSLCPSCSKFGSRHWRWKGGKSISFYGYVIVSVRGKRIPEHRLIMEKHIGRKLKLDEDVHHINGIKHDNRIENLQLMTKAEHTRLTHKGSRKIKDFHPKCLMCEQKTRSSYQLCTKHYRTQWGRLKSKLITNLMQTNNA